MLHAGGYTQACRRPGWSAGTRVRLRVRVRCNDDIVDDGFCAHERVTSGRRETHPVSSVSPVKRFWWETAAWSFQQGRSVSRDRLAAHAGPSQCPKSCPGSCACLAPVACQCVVCNEDVFLVGRSCVPKGVACQRLKAAEHLSAMEEAADLAARAGSTVCR